MTERRILHHSSRITLTEWIHGLSFWSLFCIRPHDTTSKMVYMYCYRWQPLAPNSQSNPMYQYVSPPTPMPLYLYLLPHVIIFSGFAAPHPLDLRPLYASLSLLCSLWLPKFNGIQRYSTPRLCTSTCLHCRLACYMLYPLVLSNLSRREQCCFAFLLLTPVAFLIRVTLKESC